MSKNTVLVELNHDSLDQTYKVAANDHLVLILIATENISTKITVQLAGNGAQADIFGIVLASENKQINLHTLQDHQAAHTRSNLLVKAVLTGRSLFSYEGYINVNKKAQFTDAYQKNQNLMLSPVAKAESKPALEILANNVRCTHSATVSKISEDQLFYIESRGIPKENAKKLILNGFFENILEHIPDKKAKEALLEKIERLRV